MKSLVSKIIGVLLAFGALGVGGFYGTHVVLSATNFKFAQLQPYALYGAGAISGATTITLKSMTDIDGNALSMSGDFGTKGFGTLEPGSGTQEEQIAFTGLSNNTNGTVTLTGVKNVTFTYPYTETSGLSKTHPGSATFVITNTAGFYNQLLSPLNDASIYGTYTYSSTSPPRLDQPGAQAGGTYIATTSEFATIAYVNTQTTSGCANATTGVRGCVQLGTGAQFASSTLLGSTGASLVPNSSLSTSSPYTTGSWNVWTQPNAKIKQIFFDLSELWAFTTATFTNATSTSFAVGGAAFAANGVNYRFPSTQGASSTVLTNDSTGKVTWQAPTNQTLASVFVNVSTSNTSTTTLATFVLPANTLTGAGQSLRITSSWQGTGSSQRCFMGLRFGNGTATTSTFGGATVSSVNGFAQINSSMFATSTAGEIFTAQSFAGVGQGTPNDISVAGAGAIGVSSGYMASTSLTSLAYLAFVASDLAGGDTCTLTAYTVELLKQ